MDCGNSRKRYSATTSSSSSSSAGTMAATKQLYNYQHAVSPLETIVRSAAPPKNPSFNSTYLISLLSPYNPIHKSPSCILWSSLHRCYIPTLGLPPLPSCPQQATGTLTRTETSRPLPRRLDSDPRPSMSSCWISFCMTSTTPTPLLPTLLRDRSIPTVFVSPMQEHMDDAHPLLPRPLSLPPAMKLRSTRKQERRGEEEEVAIRN